MSLRIDILLMKYRVFLGFRILNRKSLPILDDYRDCFMYLTYCSQKLSANKGSEVY